MSDTNHFEYELGQALSLPLPLSAVVTFSRHHERCSVSFDFAFSAGRMTLSDSGEWKDAAAVVRRCWIAMRDRIAGSPYYDKWDGGEVQRYSVRRRDSSGVLHPVHRVPDNFTFLDPDTAIAEAKVLRSVYIATDYVVTGHTPADEAILWDGEHNE